MHEILVVHQIRAASSPSRMTPFDSSIALRRRLLHPSSSHSDVFMSPSLFRIDIWEGPRWLFVPSTTVLAHLSGIHTKRGAAFRLAIPIALADWPWYPSCVLWSVPPIIRKTILAWMQTYWCTKALWCIYRPISLRILKSWPCATSCRGPSLTPPRP